MVQQSFYGPYDIIDDNIWCWKIIIVRCDNIHEYIDPCELINRCNIQIDPIDWCTMIPWISDTQPGIPWANAGYILGVNATGDCVQRYDPCSLLWLCWFQDIHVKVSDGDTVSGTLINKVISCDPSKLTISILNAGADEKLLICPIFPTTFVGLTDVPDTYPDCTSINANGWFVMFDNGGWVSFDCDRRSLWAARYLVGNVLISPIPINSQVVYAFSDLPTYPQVSAMPDFRWNPIMDAWSWWMQATQPGMYFVRFSVQFRVNQGIQAIRFFLVTDNNKKIISDQKDGWQASPSFTPLIDSTRSEWYFTQSDINHVWLDAGDRVSLAMRVDTNSGNDIPWEVTVFRSVLGWGTYDDPSEIANPIPGTSINMVYQWPYRFNTY